MMTAPSPLPMPLVGYWINGQNINGGSFPPSVVIVFAMARDRAVGVVFLAFDTSLHHPRRMLLIPEGEFSFIDFARQS